jgi:monoamine oxidase
MSLNNRTVTVIGAGLAGLSAAYDLHRAGWQVTVLEARERVGGRVYSLRNFSNGLVAEGGGEFIAESHKRMLAYADQFHLPLGRAGSWQGQDEDWGAFDSKAGSMSDERIWGVNLNEEVEKIWRALAELGELVPDSHEPQAARNAELIDQRSTADWIHFLDVHPLAKQDFIQHIRSEYTCEPERHSLLDLARNVSMYYTTMERDINYRVIGGNDLIPRALAKALPDLRLNAPVTSIQVSPDEVTVTYQQGNSHYTISSASAVLAVPLTTARLIEFNPPLPEAHYGMIHEVSYGAVTKVLIEYRKRFWEEKGWNGHIATDSPIVLTWHATSHIENEHGILTVYTGGAPGAKLAALPDEERIRMAVAEIENVFPGSSDLIECTATVAWPNEPYTRGSYAALAPGEVTAHWKTLFEPAGRLFFAGEHASDIQGFMEGAVESGQRAAKNIISS